MDKIEKPPVLNQSEWAKALDLLSKDEYREMVDDINQKYLYWDKVKYKKIDGKYTPKDLWNAAKVSRGFMLGHRLNFGKYQFNYTATNFIQNELHLFDLNIGGSLGTKSIIPENDKHQYLISSIMEEAIASSQIEGAVTTRKKAKDMLKKGRAPRNISEQMIVNNYKTIQYILSIKDEPITIEGLKEVHKLVTHDTLEDPLDEGRFRTSNDVDVIDAIDGETVYSPPDFNEVENLLNELCKFSNNNNHTQFIHPIVKGIIIHFMIGYIHPFVDGNGRTARALFYWYLLSKNYWLTEYLSISRMILKTKDQYAKAYLFTENDDNDLSYFIHYNVKVMKLAFEELQKYIQHKIEEKIKFNQFQKIQEVNERQGTILKWIYEEPDLLLTVKEIQIRMHVNNQTARNDLSGLVKQGFIEIVNENKKPRMYHKSKNFESQLNKNTK